MATNPNESALLATMLLLTVYAMSTHRALAFHQLFSAWHRRDDARAADLRRLGASRQESEEARAQMHLNTLNR